MDLGVGKGSVGETKVIESASKLVPGLIHGAGGQAIFTTLPRGTEGEQ
jgi:hypothetical protein